MSTRGTYNINGFMFYVHYDNYEEGAAGYFVDMIDDYVRTQRGMQNSFVRANQYAEMTNENKEAYGDTEYHYDITRNDKGEYELVVSHREWGEGWRVIHNGMLTDFINKHSDVKAFVFNKQIHTVNSFIEVIKGIAKDCNKTNKRDVHPNYYINILKEVGEMSKFVQNKEIAFGDNIVMLLTAIKDWLDAKLESMELNSRAA